jgi:hypothetical protein
MALGVPAGVPVAHGVRCSPAPTRGSGSSSRTWNTPPAVSTFAPTHHRATNALASVDHRSRDVANQQPRLAIQSAAPSHSYVWETVRTRYPARRCDPTRKEYAPWGGADDVISVNATSVTADEVIE